MAVSQEQLPKALRALGDRPNISEVVLVSTCLRTEVYAVVERFHDGVAELQQFLADLAGTTVDELADLVTCRFDDDVAAHLFEVASGITSAVPGEPEVLGQVRRAWERAQVERVVGPVLAAMFRHAVQAGKRVRAETAIAQGTTSLSHIAVALASDRRPGGVAGAKVVVVGAGEMGMGVVRALAPRGPSEIVVVNRTAARAARLLESLAPELQERSPGDGSIPCRAVPLSHLGAELAAADVAVFSVDAHHLVGAGELAAATLGRREAGEPSLVVVDLGVPRNVDPAAREVPGVALFDMDDLRSSVEEALAGRHDEVDRVRAILAEEVERYHEDARARGAAPVVSALRERLEAIRTAELARFGRKLGSLGEAEREQVDALTRGIVAKVLHDPTVALREAAGTPRGDRLVETLRSLFNL